MRTWVLCLPTVWAWCCPRATENTSSWGTHLWKKVGRCHVQMDSLEGKWMFLGILSRTNWSDRLQVLGLRTDSQSQAARRMVCVSGHRGCAASASQPSEPTEPKTCLFHTARSWEALMDQRGARRKRGRSSRGCVSLNKAEFNLWEDWGRCEKGEWEE